MNNSSADFSVQRAGDTISVAGRLTIVTAPDVLAAAANCFAGDSRTLRIDLSGLQQVDSAALAVLLEWSRRAAQREQRLEFCEVPDRLRQLAQICELEDVLEFSAAA